MNRVLGQLTADERRARVMVVDSDLEGSCGLKKAGGGSLYHYHTIIPNTIYYLSYYYYYHYHTIIPNTIYYLSYYYYYHY